MKPKLIEWGILQFLPFAYVESIGGKQTQAFWVSPEGTSPLSAIGSVPRMDRDQASIYPQPRSRFQSLSRLLLGWPLCHLVEPASSEVTLTSQPSSLLEDWQVLGAAIERLERRIKNPGRTLLCLCRNGNIDTWELQKAKGTQSASEGPRLTAPWEDWARGAVVLEEEAGVGLGVELFRWAPLSGSPFEVGQNLLTTLNDAENWIEPVSQYASPLSKSLITDNSFQV